MNLILCGILKITTVFGWNPVTKNDYPTLNTREFEKITIGEWESTGTTSDVWEGIKSGTKYSSFSTTEWSTDKSCYLGYYKMTTEDGKVFSTGTSITTTNYDGKIISNNTGFDNGQRYTGSYELIKFIDGKAYWEGFETFYGKNSAPNTYPVSFTESLVDGFNTKKTEYTRANKDTFTVTNYRFNKFKAALGNYSGIIGNWSNEDNTYRWEFSWGPFQRSISGTCYYRKPSSEMWKPYCSYTMSYDHNSESLFEQFNLPDGSMAKSFPNVFNSSDENCQLFSEFIWEDSLGNTATANRTCNFKGNTFAIEYTNNSWNGFENNDNWPGWEWKRTNEIMLSANVDTGMINTYCPISRNKLPKNCPTFTFNGKTIGFFCDNCLTKFTNKNEMQQSNIIAGISSNQN